MTHHRYNIILLGLIATMWCGIAMYQLIDGWQWILYTLGMGAVVMYFSIQLYNHCHCDEDNKPSSGGAS